MTFPDGHATRTKITRSNQWHETAPPDPRCGPPYTVPEQNGFLTGGWIGDSLRDMSRDGSQFWVYRADGSSVHFVGGPGVYQVNETFDPHGLRTEFQYDANGRLVKVVQDGGRFLTIHWCPHGYSGTFIDWVENGGGGGGVQRVSYSYANLQDSPAWLALSAVDYPEGATAHYTYGVYFGDDPGEGGSNYPLLKYAEDPRYAGAMTKIRYAYRGGSCPEYPPGGFNPNYFPALALA